MVITRVVPLVVPTKVEGKAAGAGAVGFCRPVLVPVTRAVGALVALLLLNVTVAARALVAPGWSTGDTAGRKVT